MRKVISYFLLSNNIWKCDKISFFFLFWALPHVHIEIALLIYYSLALFCLWKKVSRRGARQPAQHNVADCHNVPQRRLRWHCTQHLLRSRYCRHYRHYGELLNRFIRSLSLSLFLFPMREGEGELMRGEGEKGWTISSVSDSCTPRRSWKTLSRVSLTYVPWLNNRVPYST